MTNVTDRDDSVVIWFKQVASEMTIDCVLRNQEIDHWKGQWVTERYEHVDIAFIYPDTDCLVINMILPKCDPERADAMCMRIASLFGCETCESKMMEELSGGMVQHRYVYCRRRPGALTKAIR